MLKFIYYLKKLEVMMIFLNRWLDGIKTNNKNINKKSKLNKNQKFKD